MGESCVENIAKKDVVSAGGSLQLRAGQKLGSEVAIHAMYSLFQANFTDAALQKLGTTLLSPAEKKSN